MSTPRQVPIGATRTCPHCRAEILETAAICPSCRHYLRFDAEGEEPASPRPSPLTVEATLRQPADGEAWEYTMVFSIRNERGEEIQRQVVGVGAIHPGQARTFSLHVEAVARRGAPSGKRRQH